MQDERDRKKQEQLEKKTETKALIEQEVNSIKSTGKQPLAKITRSEIMVAVISCSLFKLYLTISLQKYLKIK